MAFDFDREVARIGRRRAIAFFLPRLALIAAVAAIAWRLA